MLEVDYIVSLNSVTVSISVLENEILTRKWQIAFSSLLLDKERRSVSSQAQWPPPECYVKYFLHQSPPQGLWWKILHQSASFANRFQTPLTRTSLRLCLTIKPAFLYCQRTPSPTSRRKVWVCIQGKQFQTAGEQLKVRIICIVVAVSPWARVGNCCLVISWPKSLWISKFQLLELFYINRVM